MLKSCIASFLREVFGLTPSEGSLVNWVNEAKRNAQPVIDKIKEYIKSSAVVGFDESGLYCNKRLDWAWIAQTVYYTLLFRADGRGSKVLVDKFGDSLERMIAVTDRHSAYFALHFLNHQVCLVHLLRELQYLSELNTEQEWSGKVANLFREAIHERNTNPNDVIDKVSWTRRLDNLLKQNIEELGKKFGSSDISSDTTVMQCIKSQSKVFLVPKSIGISFHYFNLVINTFNFSR